MTHSTLSRSLFSRDKEAFYNSLLTLLFNQYFKVAIIGTVYGI
jgi:hypothetical protein